MKVIIFANDKKEALQIALLNYPKHIFEKVYKYSKGYGNNFYQFKEPTQ